MHRRVRHLAALVAVASVVISLGATRDTVALAATPTPVVTPAQAKVVVLAYNVANNKANATYDTALQDKHEEGPARAVDDALFRVARKVGIGPLPANSLVGTKVYVPRQTSYPAVFVAFSHPQEKGEPVSTFTAAFVFRKDSSKATWKLADETNFAGAGPAMAVGKDGYLATVAPSTLQMTPALLYPSWIVAQTLAGRGANAPAYWARTGLFKRYVVLSAALATHDRRVASSEHFAPICVASAAGALCFVSTLLSDDLTLTPAEVAAGAGYHVDTADDQMALGGVDRGVYLSLHLVSQRSVAIAVPRKGGKGGLQLLAFDTEAIAGRGVKV